MLMLMPFVHNAVGVEQERWPPNTNCPATVEHCSDQVHLSLGGEGEMVVVFTSMDEATPSQVHWRCADGKAQTAHGTAHSYSALQWVDPMLIQPALGEAGASASRLRHMQNSSNAIARPYPGTISRANGVAYGLGMYNNPKMFYDAPMIHVVALRPLVSGMKCSYSVAGDSRKFDFVVPPEAGGTYPFTIGLTADLGQTAASAGNVDALRSILDRAQAGGELDRSERPLRGNAGIVLLAGDLAYADGWHSRWDSFGRMMEPLATSFAVMTTSGNHEVGAGEAWVAYNARYPMPHQQSGSRSNLWWSRDVGPAHIISLCSYCATHAGSFQHRWLLRDLANVSRQRTPWLIVMLHVPWATSNTVHPRESDHMRRAMEEPLYLAGVDLVVSGHVHAYERTFPMYDDRVNECGPVHLTLGDGGNREGVALPWSDPQPEWSAFREAAFGVGQLTIVNATHAFLNWSRTACEDESHADRIDQSDRCRSLALGPWSFGKEDKASRKEPFDFSWIVRPAKRLPGEAGCRMPPSISSVSAVPSTVESPAASTELQWRDDAVPEQAWPAASANHALPDHELSAADEHGVQRSRTLSALVNTALDNWMSVSVLTASLFALLAGFEPSRLRERAHRTAGWLRFAKDAMLSNTLETVAQNGAPSLVADCRSPSDPLLHPHEGSHEHDYHLVS